MGDKSILDIAKEVAPLLSLGEPSTLFGANVPSGSRKLRNQITKVCKYLNGRRDWGVNLAEHTWTSTATEVQANGLPSDYLRHVEETSWNRTQRRPIEGPISSNEWNALKAQVEGGIHDMFRIRDDQYLIFPTPAANETMAYEYVRNSIGKTSGGSRISAFTANEDKTLWPDELVELEVQWRYRKSEGMDYSEEYRNAQIAYHDAVKGDKGGRARIKSVSTAEHSSGRIIKPRFQDYVTS